MCQRLTTIDHLEAGSTVVSVGPPKEDLPKEDLVAESAVGRAVFGHGESRICTYIRFNILCEWKIYRAQDRLIIGQKGEVLKSNH
jgi:hypothetical protein